MPPRVPAGGRWRAGRTPGRRRARAQADPHASSPYPQRTAVARRSGRASGPRPAGAAPALTGAAALPSGHGSLSKCQGTASKILLRDADGEAKIAPWGTLPTRASPRCAGPYWPTSWATTRTPGAISRPTTGEKGPGRLPRGDAGGPVGGGAAAAGLTDPGARAQVAAPRGRGDGRTGGAGGGAGSVRRLVGARLRGARPAPPGSVRDGRRHPRADAATCLAVSVRSPRPWSRGVAAPGRGRSSRLRAP